MPCSDAEPEKVMRRGKAWAIIVIIVAAGCSNEPAPVLDPEAADALDAVLGDAVAGGQIPGVVGLVTGRDAVLYRGAFGVMDATGNAPMRADAIFRIFSMTKPITSAGVMMLVEEGQISLDDPASTYLPELADREVLVSVDPADSSIVTRHAVRTMTVLDLLRHTSGFGYSFSNQTLLDWTRASGLPELEQPLLHEPGERWTYGSSTYFLGRIIERVSGETLVEFLGSRVFDRLGMSDTSFDLDPADASRLVAIYGRKGITLMGQPNPPRYQANIRGDGGLLSTADDYARFIRAILGNGATAGTRLLSAESVAEMTHDRLVAMTVTEQPGAIPSVSRSFPLGAGRDGFGLGFQVAAVGPADMRPKGSLSWAGLLNTHFWIDRSNGLGVVLMMQVSPFYDQGAIDALRAFERALYQHVQ